MILIIGGNAPDLQASVVKIECEICIKMRIALNNFLFKVVL